ITQTLNGEWRFSDTNGRQVMLQKNENAPYTDDATKLAVAGATVKMQHPPKGFSSVLFYPGEFYKVDRASQATQVPLPLGFNSHLYSADRLDSISPPSSGGTYVATIEFSTATQTDLESAGTDYPGWLQPFMSLPTFGYRPPEVIDKEHNLALDIVNKAGARTEYEIATAIEEYLRNSANFTYTLEPPTAPANEDRLNFFLFDPNGRRQGYCEYFATAMGDMLRSLGIPTRLVNGYGPGAFDPAANGVVVRSDDAHTWVEVYFPHYGWIPFEPTADGTYNVIPRGQSDPNACLRDQGCDNPNVPGTVGPGASPTPGGRGNRQVGGPDIPVVGGGGFSFSSLGSAGVLTKIVAVLVAMLLLALAAASRYLRPRSVMAVWRRMLMLASLAGAERRPGETPLELGRRLQRVFPEAAEPVGALAGGFTIAAYAPPDLASNARTTVMESWSTLRPLLLRRVFARLRPSRP
ncbi:MAG TPA: transglutaminase domain-containing protein, partial [Candidatus Dormibacteraeota bacterium]|nr:transglutaminase domain-containing protein [Candidatus Dormibacteraeota bacterium]